MDEGKTGAATTAQALCADGSNAHCKERETNRQKRRGESKERGNRKKISHAPYSSAKILFYFCAANFFRAAFSSPGTHKIEVSLLPFSPTPRENNSTLGTLLKNKPTIRKNSADFRPFSTTFRREFISRSDNLSLRVKAHSRFRLLARVLRALSDFSIFTFTASPKPTKQLNHKLLWVKASPLHPSPPQSRFRLFPTQNR